MLDSIETIQVSFILGFVLAGGIGFLSYRAGFLSGSGAIGTFVMGTVIFGMGRLQWSCPILTFFILSSLLSKLGRPRKEKLRGIVEKSGPRDIAQVLTNGGIPTAFLLFHLFFPAPIWFLLYLSVLAAVNADTWGTEIGTLSNRQPRQITTFRRAPTGTSGGITVLGTTGSLVGAFVIAASGLPWMGGSTYSLRDFLLIGFVGFLSSGIDSLLGATVQGQYQCPKCLETTERKQHCDGADSRLTRGLKWIDNDVVNLLCSLSGAVLFFLLMKLWS